MDAICVVTGTESENSYLKTGAIQVGYYNAKFLCVLFFCQIYIFCFDEIKAMAFRRRGDRHGHFVP